MSKVGAVLALVLVVGCNRPHEAAKSASDAPAKPAPHHARTERPNMPSMDTAYLALSSRLADGLLRDPSLVVPIAQASSTGPVHVPAEIQSEIDPRRREQLAFSEVPAAELAAVVGPVRKAADSFLRTKGFQLDEVRDGLAIANAGHTLHVVLAGTEWEPTAPPGDAVFGGTPVGPDLGFGPARIMTATQVAATAAALEKLTPKLFAKRFDAAAAGGQLPDPELQEGDGREASLQFYALLRAYFMKAAARGDGMMLTLS